MQTASRTRWSRLTSVVMVNVRPFYFAFERRTQPPLYLRHSMLRLVTIAVLVAWACLATIAAQTTEPFRWAGDAEGGAPYVEADPADPSRVVGFDADVAELVATGPRPHAAICRSRVCPNRSIHRPGRRRDRPERHRRYARAPRHLRCHPSLLSVSRGFERPLG